MNRLGFLDSLKKDKKPKEKEAVDTKEGLPTPPPFNPATAPKVEEKTETKIEAPKIDKLTPPDDLTIPPKEGAPLTTEVNPPLSSPPTPPPQMTQEKTIPEPVKKEVVSPPVMMEGKPPETPKKAEIPKLPDIPPVPKFEMEKTESVKSVSPPDTIVPQKTEPIKKELPSFPTDSPKPSSAPDELPEIPDMEVPEPPPNLRSELSPLELEKLEKEYLGKRIVISDVEQPYEYDRHKGVAKPLYVKTDEYRKMLNYFIEIKQQLTESDETIFRVENIKKNQDREFNDYKRTIEDIQRKLIFIDKTIFEN